MKPTRPIVLTVSLEAAAQAVAVLASADDKSLARQVVEATFGQHTAERISRLAVHQQFGDDSIVMLTVATDQCAVPDGKLEVAKLGHFEGVTLVLAQQPLAMALAGKHLDDTVVGLSLTETDVTNFAIVLDAYKTRTIGVGFAAYGDQRMPATEVVGYEFDGERMPRVVRLEANNFQRLPTGMAVAHNNRLVFATGEQLKRLLNRVDFNEIFAGQRMLEIGSESKLAAIPKPGGETDLVVIDRRNGIARFYSADANLTPRSEVELNALRSDATGQQIFAMFGQLDGSVVIAETDVEHTHLGQVMRLRRTDDIGADGQQVAAEAK